MLEGWKARPGRVWMYSENSRLPVLVLLLLVRLGAPLVLLLALLVLPLLGVLGVLAEAVLVRPLSAFSNDELLPRPLSDDEAFLGPASFTSV